METTELHYCIALTLLAGIGPRSAKLLISHYGDPEDFFNDKKLHKNSVPGFSKMRLKTLNRTEALLKAEKHVDFILKNKITPVFYKSKNYPSRLKNCIDAPLLLYSKGDFETNPNRCIAVVGTRNATPYGKKIVEELIQDLQPVNVQVVSGMAYGIDVLTHKACLKYSVPTVGVLGHGLDRIYPAQHKSVAKKMIASDGGLLTEFLEGTLPERENFPMRNRIVAGMTDATIVIESGKKGGSLITANLANDYNRDVFAFPGNIDSPFSEGCNNLIANDKAHLITSAEQIIDVMGWKHQLKTAVQTQLFPELKPEEKQVVELLKEVKELSVDNIANKLKKPVSVLNSILLGLELQGLICAIPGNKFKLS